MMNRLLRSRAREYLLLLISQALLVAAGFVGSACSEYSPSPTYSVPDPADRVTDGGIKASSIGADAVLAPKTKVAGVQGQVPITWTVIPPKDLLVLPPSTDPETGGTKVTIFKGKAKPPGETLKFIGKFVVNGKVYQDTFNLRVKVE